MTDRVDGGWCTMKMPDVAVVIPALLVLSAACTGAVAPVGAPDQPAAVGDAESKAAASASPTVDVDAATAPAATTPSKLPTCAEPSGDIEKYSSPEHLNAKISGVWFLCSGSIWSPADTAGIEISSGRAHHLVVSGGTLVRGSTPDYQRTLTARESGSPGVYQVDMKFNNGGNFYDARTSVDGRFLELFELTSSKRGRYVRAPHVAPACAAVAGPNQVLTSIADTRARVTGKWRICSGVFINSPAGTAGLELTADRAYYLQDSPTGLTRAGGWDYERDLAITEGDSEYFWYELRESNRSNNGSGNISQDGDKLVLTDPMGSAPTVLARVH